MNRAHAIASNYDLPLEASDAKPVEVLPLGAIIINDERAAMLNGFPEGSLTPDF